MPWRVTVDQRTPAGSVQRHGPATYDAPYANVAISAALRDFDLLFVEVGDYQITVTHFATAGASR